MCVCTCKIPAQKEKKTCCEYKETNFISISPTNNDICSSFVKDQISSFLLQLHLKNPCDPCATFWVLGQLGQAARLTLAGMQNSSLSRSPVKCKCHVRSGAIGFQKGASCSPRSVEYKMESNSSSDTL